MAIIERCPHCNSFPLIRHGEPSPLDGKRQLRCLGCGIELPPRRSKTLAVISIIFGCLFGLPLCVLGVWLVWHWIYRYMLVPFIGAGGCFTAVVLSWRALHATTPIAVITAEYPSAAVSLVSYVVSAQGDVPAKPAWAESLSNFVNGVIKAAGECLAAGGSYTASIIAECDKAGIRYVVQYRGTPNTSALEKLSAEIDKLPTFGIPEVDVKVTLSFQVSG